MEWSDGAQAGVGPEQAMRAAIGDEEPTDILTKEQMRARIASFPLKPEGDYDNYDEAAWAIAAVVLAAYLEYPQLQQLPAESVILRNDQGAVWQRGEDGEKTALIYLTSDLYDVIKKIYGENSPQRKALIGSSGFQWGWAVNAARRCLDLPEAPNPALLVVSV